jgi:hypothetical protein
MISGCFTLIGWGQVDVPSEESDNKTTELEKKVRLKRTSIFVDEEEDSLLAKEYDKHDGKFGTGVDFGFNILLNNSLSEKISLVKVVTFLLCSGQKLLFFCALYGPCTNKKI